MFNVWVTNLSFDCYVSRVTPPHVNKNGEAHAILFTTPSSVRVTRTVWKTSMPCIHDLVEHIKLHY